jgi:hypothetical protein
MGFKALALAGTAAAAVSVGMAAPALAAEPMHHGRGGGCHHFCVAHVYKHGVNYGTVKVVVSKHSIRGVLHLTRDAKKGYYGIKGHCKPIGHRTIHHEVVNHRVVHRMVPTRTVVFRHHQVRVVPRASSTGFGGASNEQANLPLIGGALAMIAGGLGVGVLARRRVTGAEK